MAVVKEVCLYLSGMSLLRPMQIPAVLCVILGMYSALFFTIASTAVFFFFYLVTGSGLG